MTWALAAGIALAAISLGAQGRGGQRGAPPVVPPQQDFSAVEIKTTKVAASFSALEGRGGTIGALAGPDGVFLVDSQFPQLTDKIVAAIKQISNAPIRFLVNTHVHGDHTGGNENFAKLGVVILARPELRARLIQPAAGRGRGAPAPVPPAARPVLTYTGLTTVHMNGEDIRLIPVPAAHTDGDTMVRFPNADVLMLGDFFRTVGYPNIDRNNGGTLPGLLDGLQAAIALATATTKVIPGHGPITDRAGVTLHRDMILALRDRVAALVKQGKTLEEVVAAKLTAEYDALVRDPGTTGDRFVGQLYEELKR
jgi:glyoxylase-like metal-dependent hydrolase (beta-lactamase superfamily II)